MAFFSLANCFHCDRWIVKNFTDNLSCWTVYVRTVHRKSITIRIMTIWRTKQANIYIYIYIYIYRPVLFHTQGTEYYSVPEHTHPRDRSPFDSMGTPRVCWLRFFLHHVRFTASLVCSTSCGSPHHLFSPPRAVHCISIFLFWWVVLYFFSNCPLCFAACCRWEQNLK
jgi:hypothetical protein